MVCALALKETLQIWPILHKYANSFLGNNLQKFASHIDAGEKSVKML
jgi:capsule polysaccharide modification protein KpsS